MTTLGSLADRPGRGCWRVDYLSQRVHWSPGMFQLTGKNPLTFVPTIEYMSLAFPSLRETLLLWALRPDSAEDQQFSCECPISDQGTWMRTVLLCATPQVRDGSLERVTGICHDLDQLKHQTVKMTEQDELYHMLFKYAPNGLVQAGADKRIIMVNPALCTLLGYSAEELLTMTTEDITHPDDHAVTAAAVKRLQSGEVEHLTYDKRYVRKNGSYIWIQLSVSLFRGLDGLPRNFIGQCQDISWRKKQEVDMALQLSGMREKSQDLQQQNKELINIISTDYLTDLSSRASFDLAVEELRNNAGSVGAIITIEIGSLTLRNRTYGAKAVDELLRSVARVLVGVCPEAACIARISGGVFKLLLRSVDAAAIAKLTTLIEQSIGAIKWGRGLISPAIAAEWVSGQPRRSAPALSTRSSISNDGLGPMPNPAGYAVASIPVFRQETSCRTRFL